MVSCRVIVNCIYLTLVQRTLNTQIRVYTHEDSKPPVGNGLNKEAEVTLHGVLPRDKKTGRPIKVKMYLYTGLGRRYMCICTRRASRQLARV